MKKLFALAVLLASIVATSRTAAAGNTLTVYPGCFNNGINGAACNAYVSGGTGTYVSYHWQITDSHWGQPTYNYTWSSTDPWLSYSCRLGGSVTFTLTVTDSQGETGTGTHTINCSGDYD